MDKLLYKENMISVTRLFHVSFKEKYSVGRSSSQKSLILQPAALATLLNFERSCYFQASYFSRIFRISGIADLQY